MRSFRILILLLLCLYMSTPSWSQILGKTVTLNYRDAKVKDVLLGLESKYGVKFYYANNLIPLNTRVNVNVRNQPLSDALDKIFQETDISFVAVEDKIVLKKNPNKKKEQRLEKKKSSEVINSANNTTPVTASASIDPNNLYPAFTLEEIQSTPVVNEETFALELKELEIDTTLNEGQNYIRQKNKLTKRFMAKMDSLGKIGDEGSMQELKEKFVKATQKLKEKIKRSSDSLKSRAPLFRDKNDTSKFISPVQFTFVHPLGTNGAAAENAINRSSFNLITGKAYALEGAEFGGIMNAERSYVKGAQFGGIVNMVGAEMNGAQFAGITNLTKGMANGAQFAGIANINGDSALGFQAAGITNVVKGSYVGAQLAGIANVNNGSSDGFQAAGITNVNQGPTRGAKIAGIANISGEEHNGVQIAGILNKAKRVRGSQIGLINIADTVTGATVGLINIVKNGYNKFEIYVAEGLYANVGFRFGTPRFHTLLTIGAQPSDNKDEFRLGYGAGFGMVFPMAEKHSFNLDVMANHINEGYEAHTNTMNMLNQLKLHYEFKAKEHVRFFVGPTVNVMVSTFYDAKRARYGSNLVPNTIFDETYEGKEEDDLPVNVKIWAGFNAGMRF